MGQNLYSWDAEMTADATLEGLERACGELRQDVREIKTAIDEMDLRMMNRFSLVLGMLDELTGREPGERVL